MASERVRVRRNVVSDPADVSETPELTEVFSEAQASQHDFLKETNRSKEVMLRMELEAKAKERESDLLAKAQEQRSNLGVVGRFTGGKDNSPTSIALVAVVCGILATFTCFFYAAHSSSPESGTRSADGCLAFALSSLTFIFGRGSRR